MSRFHALSAGNTERPGSGGGGAGDAGGLVVARQASPSASVRANQRLMPPNSTRPCRVDVVPVTRRLRPCPTSATTGILARCPMSKVKVGIVGSRFQADCIARAVKAVPEEAELVAVASPTKGHAAEFAKRHGIPQGGAYTDYRDLLRDPQVELISITAPNRLHAQITIDAAKAGKHVVCEK